MKPSERMVDFNKRWGIIPDTTQKENFDRFKIRILNDFSLIDPQLSQEASQNFCRTVGIKFHHGGYLHVLNYIESVLTEIELYRSIEIILNLPIHPSRLGTLKENLEESIRLSQLNVRLSFSNEKGYFLIPAGEPEFDSKLVDDIISFSNPESKKHFIEALTFSLKKTPNDAIKSAEHLRRFLEEFLRYKLGNQKGLQENIPALGKKLKAVDKTEDIRGWVIKFFNHMDHYFNNQSKHEDGDIGESENEYLIYQAGVLARYIERTI